MQDYSKLSSKQKKISQNKIKVKKEPFDWKKFAKPLKIVGKLLFLISAISAVIFFGAKSFDKLTFSRLKNIEISKTARVSREEVIALLGVSAGNDLLKMNLKQMGENVVRNPWVESVHIRRYFPDTISVSILEREPVAVVNMGLLYYLDAKGIPFKVLNQGDSLDYPVITGISEDDFTADPKTSKDALIETTKLIDSLKKNGSFMLAEISEIHYDKGYGFTLFTSSEALPVKVGSGDYSSKLYRFARIYKDVMKQRSALHYIDLDYNDKIVIKKS